MTEEDEKNTLKWLINSTRKMLKDYENLNETELKNLSAKLILIQRWAEDDIKKLENKS